MTHRLDKPGTTESLGAVRFGTGLVPLVFSGSTITGWAVKANASSIM